MGKTFQKASVLLGKAEGVPSLVETVQFHGVNFTKNDALVKEVAELYSSQTLHELVEKSHLAARHLQEVGLMDSAVAFIDTAPSANGYTVNFVVKEPKPYVLGAKCGMSTNGDADVSLTGGCQSIGGRGESFNTSYTYTVKGDHNFNVTYNKPKLGWQVHSNCGASAYRSLAFLPWNQSNLDENALIFHYNGQLWQKRLLHAIKFNTIWRTLRAGEDSSFTVREHAGHTMKFSLDNSIAMDSRDRPLLATKGILFRIAQEFAGPFGDSSFVRHQIDFQAATPLPFDTILSASVQAKQVRALGEREVHLIDRVYLGGQHDVRGFALNSLGPREENSTLGGGTAAAAVLHLYKPLFPRNMLYAHAFVAGGSVASLRARDVMIDLQETSRVSAGIGLTFAFKNIFRLELNYVHPLKFGVADIINRGFHIGAGINFL